MRKDTGTQTSKSGAAQRGREALRPEGVDTHVPARFCDIAGCSEGAEYRAPKSPGRLNDYFWFCLEHVRAYNKSWNYYADMSDVQVEDAIRRATTWERPSWRFGTRKNDGRYFGGAGFRDDFGLFDDDPSVGERGARQEHHKAHSPEAQALVVMELTAPVTMEELKSRYKQLAKLNHPDRNGGDKEAEERLKLINEAYTTLKRFLT